MTLTEELQQAVAMLFNRRLGTAWSEKELKVFNALVKDNCLNDLEQIRVISRYYGFERRKKQEGIHRRDLYTFLNNFNGELDRARAWDENTNQSKKLAVFAPKSEGTSAEEWQRIADLAKAELAKLREEFRMPAK